MSLQAEIKQDRPKKRSADADGVNPPDPKRARVDKSDKSTRVDPQQAFLDKYFQRATKDGHVCTPLNTKFRNELVFVDRPATTPPTKEQFNKVLLQASRAVPQIPIALRNLALVHSYVDPADGLTSTLLHSDLIVSCIRGDIRHGQDAKNAMIGAALLMLDGHTDMLFDKVLLPAAFEDIGIGSGPLFQRLDVAYRFWKKHSKDHDPACLSHANCRVVEWDSSKKYTNLEELILECVALACHAPKSVLFRALTGLALGGNPLYAFNVLCAKDDDRVTTDGFATPTKGPANLQAQQATAGSSTERRVENYPPIQRHSTERVLTSNVALSYNERCQLFIDAVVNSSATPQLLASLACVVVSSLGTDLPLEKAASTDKPSVDTAFEGLGLFVSRLGFKLREVGISESRLDLIDAIWSLGSEAAGAIHPVLVLTAVFYMTLQHPSFPLGTAPLTSILSESKLADVVSFGKAFRQTFEQHLSEATSSLVKDAHEQFKIHVPQTIDDPRLRTATGQSVYEGLRRSLAKRSKEDSTYPLRASEKFVHERYFCLPANSSEDDAKRMNNRLAPFMGSGFREQRTIGLHLMGELKRMSRQFTGVFRDLEKAWFKSVVLHEARFLDARLSLYRAHALQIHHYALDALFGSGPNSVSVFSEGGQHTTAYIASDGDGMTVLQRQFEPNTRPYVISSARVLNWIEQSEQAVIRTEALRPIEYIIMREGGCARMFAILLDQDETNLALERREREAGIFRLEYQTSQDVSPSKTWFTAARDESTDVFHSMCPEYLAKRIRETSTSETKSDFKARTTTVPSIWERAMKDEVKVDCEFTINYAALKPSVTKSRSRIGYLINPKDPAYGRELLTGKHAKQRMFLDTRTSTTVVYAYYGPFVSEDIAKRAAACVRYLSKRPWSAFSSKTEDDTSPIQLFQAHLATNNTTSSIPSSITSATSQEKNNWFISVKLNSDVEQAVSTYDFADADGSKHRVLKMGLVKTLIDIDALKLSGNTFADILVGTNRNANSPPFLLPTRLVASKEKTSGDKNRFSYDAHFFSVLVTQTPQQQQRQTLSFKNIWAMIRDADAVYGEQFTLASMLGSIESNWTLTTAQSVTRYEFATEAKSCQVHDFQQRGAYSFENGYFIPSMFASIPSTTCSRRVYLLAYALDRLLAKEEAESQLKAQNAAPNPPNEVKAKSTAVSSTVPAPLTRSTTSSSTSAVPLATTTKQAPVTKSEDLVMVGQPITTDSYKRAKDAKRKQKKRALTSPHIQIV